MVTLMSGTAKFINSDSQKNIRGEVGEAVKLTSASRKQLALLCSSSFLGFWWKCSLTNIVFHWSVFVLLYVRGFWHSFKVGKAVNCWLFFQCRQIARLWVGIRPEVPKTKCCHLTALEWDSLIDYLCFRIAFPTFLYAVQKLQLSLLIIFLPLFFVF